MSYFKKEMKCNAILSTNINNFVYLYLLFLSDLFGKAKKKILKQTEISEAYSSPVLPYSQKYKQEIDWGEQEIGWLF